MSDENAGSNSSVSDGSESPNENAPPVEPPSEQTGSTATERGWDGWPTAPTPNNLIPKIGEVPVSSTVHFQTVAMTSLGDNTSGDAIWTRVRSPLLAALRRNAVQELVIVNANYGDSEEHPRMNVTDRVQEMVSGRTLEMPPPEDVFFDLGPGRPKQFRMRYRNKGIEFVANKLAHEGFSLRGDLRIEGARYGDLASGDSVDVAEIVASLVVGGDLSVDASNGTFGRDPAPGVRKRLEVSYVIDGMYGAITVDENETLRLAGGLEVLEAVWGVLPSGESTAVGRHDVTDVVVPMIDDGRLSVRVDVGLFGEPEGSAGVHHLFVLYREDGEDRTADAAEGETLTIGRRYPTDPTEVHQMFFDPPPSSIAELAQRFTDGGLIATDLNANSTDLTMEDELNALIGIAPQERLDPVTFAESDAMDTPAEGVILFHEQGWYGRGLALGNLLHSVALAPGEVTQVAMTNWNHATRGSDSEVVSQADETSTADNQNRAVSEVQGSSLQEHTSGDSSGASTSTSDASGTSSTDVHLGLGFGSVHAGVSGSTNSHGSSSTVTSAVAHSNGSKELAMEGNQQINATTRRHAEAARTRRAAVVREVSQGENENLTTRVLANYNHMHALTVMYFEVIEVYSLRTRVVDAERVIFLPFRVRDVQELIHKYRAILVAAATSAGNHTLADAIRYIALEFDGDGRPLVSTGELDSEIKLVVADITSLDSRIATIDTKIGAVSLDSAAARQDISTKLQQLDGERVKIIDEIDHDKASGSLFAGFAIQQAQNRLRPVEQRSARERGSLEAMDAADRNALTQLRRERAALQHALDDAQARSRHLARVMAMIGNVAASSGTRPLERYRLFLNQAVWLNLSPGEVLGLARRRHTFRGEPIFEQIDPAPVAVSGNYVGYRWRFQSSAETQEFQQRFVQPFEGDPNQDLASVLTDVAVPTGGVFGEAVLGEAVSAEKIDLSRFWNWKDSPIPILPTSINPLSAATPTVQDLSTAPGALDASSAKLDPLQALPDPAGFAALAQTMQAQTFRDMSGQELLKTLAEATTKAASNSETHASDVASTNLKAGLDFIASMAEKAAAVAMAPETGGASLMGGLVDADESGGSSVLGGVLNAKESDGKHDLLARLTGDTSGGRAPYEFPKVPDHEPGMPDFPKVPDHKPGAPESSRIPESELEESEPDE